MCSSWSEPFLSDSRSNVRGMYSPWRDARSRHHLTIRLVDHLPAGVRGRLHGNEILLRRHQLQDERRMALGHELVHDERRIFPSDPVLCAREEAIVERIAARRLIALDRLVDVLRWTRHTDEIADELWVDVAMLTALVQSLTAAERKWIDTELERGEG